MSNSPTRIAVVDDDVSVRNALQRFLAISGFDARSFSCGREFLEFMPEWDFDCLIVDLKMPEMTGRELLREVGERTPDLQAILMTASDDPQLRAECEGSGATAYLVKPIDGDDLIEAICSCARTRGESRLQPSTTGEPLSTIIAA